MTPPAAIVTPFHTPSDTPIEVPLESALEQDSLMDFEGKQFHYLDSISFGSSSDDDYPLNDVVMV